MRHHLLDSRLQVRNKYSINDAEQSEEQGLRDGEAHFMLDPASFSAGYLKVKSAGSYLPSSHPLPGGSQKQTVLE